MLPPAFLCGRPVFGDKETRLLSWQLEDIADAVPRDIHAIHPKREFFREANLNDIPPSMRKAIRVPRRMS
jgi:hypothetical protein